jgi:phosphohistidine swiveling domain-containing protein
LVTEGRLDHAADVFHLRADELREAVGESWGKPLRSLVQRRAATREQARDEAPAAFFGGPPPDELETPPMVAKFYGVAGSASHDGDRLIGTGASSGTVTAVARVVRGPEDFARVSGGEVLVCTTTTPAWTPLFPSLAALVTDTGGVLCHAAVVAREYGLPAVVGAEVATQRIPDGALVRVDGESDEVEILRGATISSPPNA